MIEAQLNERFVLQEPTHLALVDRMSTAALSALYKAPLEQEPNMSLDQGCRAACFASSLVRRLAEALTPSSSVAKTAAKTHVQVISPMPAL